MTNDDQDLAKLNLFRMSMSPIGNLIITALTLPFIRLMGGDRKAWIIVTAIYGVIAIAMLMWTFFGTRRTGTDMKRIIGIVGEGPTDFLILKTAIDRITGEKNIYRRIQPEQDMRGEYGNGWKGVYRWCEANAAYIPALFSGISPGWIPCRTASSCSSCRSCAGRHWGTNTSGIPSP